ncbi:MAG: hypothetical protein DMD38_02105 [Gemmatimonadetes bacterium]|nr:MAG: hypothetical protein AUI09_00620 [Gemmatimonadetes bacterium 13_2_20CM_2_66_5]OLC87093.1 MAG: hypothetical protein AUI86_07530 [Gemmatimonadetes bacterium 13_1_40CM_3_66_12]OLD85498.1 MAG: hypothetical protein AUG85_12980 [Gemmatimonadetes bacterium 13_1_20CM_4_66_11]PYP98203.1 MAG: hypothetical protein DMD38_02105 [Gemmatimonadota bacterium]
MTQADLFGPEALPPPSPELVQLGRGIPPGIRFGTSTWTYDGWFGDVYHRRYRGPQPAKRLEEYTRYPLFRTVGIDSVFYDPPSEEELQSYARALPPAFPCVSKVWDRITAMRLGQDSPQPGLAGMRNPDFLNAVRFKDNVLGAYSRVFRDHAGCFVFEFQAMRGKDLPDPLQWADQLDDFLSELPKDFRYAVELRNPELLTPVHGEVLKRHGVAHVFNSWTEMPPIGEQIDLGWTFPTAFTVARALLKPGRRYADAVKQFQPYDRVQEPLRSLRQDLLRLVSEAHRRRVEAFILANNRAEGNAPGTIRAVARMWVEGDAEAT